MLRESFTVAPFEQSPYAYRDGLVEIAAHKDFDSGFFSYNLIKGRMCHGDEERSKEIDAFLWAFKDFFNSKSAVNHYCSGKTFVRSDKITRTYGLVIEGHTFKYNVRITNDTDLNGVNFFIVVNKKTAVAAA